MPAAISKAITAVMADIYEPIEKRGENTYDNYKYVSIDDIYARLVRSMGVHGLVIIPLEIDVEHTPSKNRQGNAVIRAKFTHQFFLSCDGESWTDDTCCRTLAMQIDRTTNYAAAGSYLEKAFLRSLFKIPTGEVEVEELEEIRARHEDKEDGKAKRMKQVRNKNGYSSPKQIADDNRWQEFENAATNASDLSELSNVHDRYVDLKTGLKEIPFDTVIERAEERIAAENAAALEQMKLHGFVDQAEIERLNLDKVGKHKDAER
jgi:hypothetical protein